VCVNNCCFPYSLYFLTFYVSQHSWLNRHNSARWCSHSVILSFLPVQKSFSLVFLHYSFKYMCVAKHIFTQENFRGNSLNAFGQQGNLLHF
jgi:hypothetical protein